MEKKLDIKIGLDNVMSVTPPRRRLFGLESSGYEFKIKFLLFVIVKFLSTTMKYSLKRDWVHVIENIENVKEFK